MTFENYQEILRSGLVNQRYIGHRPDLWDEQTSVTFTKPASKTVQLYVAQLPQEPIFQSYKEATGGTT